MHHVLLKMVNFIVIYLVSGPDLLAKVKIGNGGPVATFYTQWPHGRPDLQWNLGPLPIIKELICVLSNLGI